MKTNRSEYVRQHVSTLDFVLIISGNYHFDDIIDASSDGQRNAYNKLRKHSLDNQQPCFSRVLNKLNNDIGDYQHAGQFDDVEFPNSHSLCTKTSRGNHDTHWKYEIGDLIGWVSTKYDLTDYLLADWFKEELKKRAVDNKSTDVDKGKDYIKIDTLPKILQLMIEVCNKQEYDIDNSSYDEQSAKDKLESLAINQGVFFGNNQRTTKGLGNINAKKIIEYIQKDKN
jgi:hypothetical protein